MPNIHLSMRNIILLFFLFVFISCANYGEKKVFYGTEVYYKEGVTEAEVEKLGQSLITSGFADGNRKSVQYLKNGDTFVFKMVIKESFLNDKKYEQMFKFMPNELSSYVGAPVDFHLTDNEFNTLREYKHTDAEKTLMAKNTEIRYTNNVTKEEAQKLGDFLINYEFATNDKAKTVALDKENDTYIFKVVVDTEATNLDAMEAFLTFMKTSLSKDVFKDHTVKVHMCDPLFNTIKEI